jgi:hypothetical protein
MFKSRADESPKVGTVSKETRKATSNLDRALKNAEKKGKKLTDAQIVRIGLKNARQLTSIFSPKGSRGKITARGIRGKVGNKGDTQLSLNKLQRWKPESVGKVAEFLQTKTGKTLLKSIERLASKNNGAKGKAGVKAIVNGINKRSKGKDVAKLKPSTRPKGGSKK